MPIVRNCIAALLCQVEDEIVLSDHHLLFARVTNVKTGRLREAPLLYSSRLGWRIGSEKAREPGRSIRDELLHRLARAGFEIASSDGEDPD
jgi:flavin reductase (DIM6/NTAB) family NADH-FMN oxidoreductase RutF